MDTRDLHDKGLKLRREMFGREAVEQRTNAFGAFGEPLQTVINAYAYGDIWSRPGLPLKTKSLAAVAMTAAIGRASELRVHVNGALTNGCTAEEIREFCCGQIAKFKIPESIRFVDSFPMTVTGKIQKFKIREVEIKERGLEGVAQIQTA